MGLATNSESREAQRLVPLLEDPVPIVAAQAAWALGRQADPMATPALAALLAGTRPSSVLLAALDAWWRLPGASPEPAATHLRAVDPSVRHAAAVSLRRLDDPDGLPLLATALDDPHPIVRAAAIRGLHEAPMPVVQQHLIPALGDDDWSLRVAAADRIRGYGDFYHYHLLAAGKIEAVIESDVNILDIAALAATVSGWQRTSLAPQNLSKDTAAAVSAALTTQRSICGISW